MIMRLTYRRILCFLVVLLPLHNNAQTTIKVAPQSFGSEAPSLKKTQDLDLRQLAVPNLEKVRSQDRENPSNRFSTAIPVNLSWNEGQWENLANGDRIWRLRIQSRDALGLAVFYDSFYLPPGSTLHMYDGDRSQVIGAYTSANNPKSGKFWTGFTRGSSTVLEYFEPRAVRDQGKLHIFRVDYAYHSDNFKVALRSSALMDFGFGTSDACNNNINCTEGQAYQQEKKGICRILMVLEEGTGFCTGNLINNTSGDHTPYVLSAFHCQDGFTPEYEFWRFDFNYESSDCSNPDREPAFQSILGSQLRAGRQSNDFLLVELLNQIPNSFDTYFFGWDRSSTAPQDATLIHHPKGDIKKISTSSGGVQIFNRAINWNNDVTTPANHHFDATFDDGSFEVGSSGGALIDENRRIVGQLHGGNAACDNAQAFFGRLALSWEGGGSASTRLKDWLDPNDSGAMTTDGEVNQNMEGITVGGIVLTDGGDPIPNTVVQIFGSQGLALSTVSDQQGNYSFSNVPANDTYQIIPFKNDDAGSGLSVLDLIQVRKHILNVEPFSSPYQILAADVNNSSSVSTIDLIQIQKVILGRDAAFEDKSTWTFLPANAIFMDNTDPFLGLISGSFVFALGADPDDINDFDIIGIKAGDVNNSADLE